MATTPSTISSSFELKGKSPQLNLSVVEVGTSSAEGSIAPVETSTKTLTAWRKAAIATCLLASSSILFFSFGSCMGGALDIGKSFGVNDPIAAAWLAASYSLTQGAFVLVSGRIGSIYGHKNVLFVGAIWWVIWTLINGFCTQGVIPFAIARAMSGIGAAFMSPNIIAIIGITFPPGKMRNLTFGCIGFGAPVGGVGGILLLGVFIEFASWRWFFFMMAILGTVLFSTLWMILPPEERFDNPGNVDWVGAALGLTALVLFNFVWNQAPAVSWLTPYEPALLVASIILFVLFGYYEHKIAVNPIMPLDIWTAPSFFALILVVLFCIMAYGVALWYLVAWQQLIRNWTVLHFGIGMIPHLIFGCLSAPIAAWLIPRVAAQWILAFGALSVILSAILLATMPEQQSYWAQVFPATILMSLCPDFIFTAAQIIATNSVKRHEQGIAGSLISLLQLYGASIGLGFAGTVETRMNGGGAETVKGYRSALYLAIGLGIAALIIDMVFVRVPRDTREGWDEDREEAQEMGIAGK